MLTSLLALVATATNEATGCCNRDGSRCSWFPQQTARFDTGASNTHALLLPLSNEDTTEWCEAQASLAGKPFQTVSRRNGAPAGCIENAERFSWVQTCTGHPNCGTDTCNGCTVHTATIHPDLCGGSTDCWEQPAAHLHPAGTPSWRYRARHEQCYDTYATTLAEQEGLGNAVVLTTSLSGADPLGECYGLCVAHSSQPPSPP